MKIVRRLANLEEITIYCNQLFVVGRTWEGFEATNVYTIKAEDETKLQNAWSDRQQLAEIIRKSVGDFAAITDFRIDLYEDVLNFEDIDSANLFDLNLVDEEGEADDATDLDLESTE